VIIRMILGEPLTIKHLLTGTTTLKKRLRTEGGPPVRTRAMRQFARGTIGVKTLSQVLAATGTNQRMVQAVLAKVRTTMLVFGELMTGTEMETGMGTMTRLSLQEETGEQTTLCRVLGSKHQLSPLDPIGAIPLQHKTQMGRLISGENNCMIENIYRVPGGIWYPQKQ
jgi:hypothetical protein